MAAKSRILDGGGTGLEAGVHQDTRSKAGPNGLVSYTEERRIYQSESAPFVNATYGIDMNVNAAFGGTPDGVHNGNDSVLWTDSALIGTWDFSSTAQAQSGSQSIDATSTVGNNEAQLERGSTIDLSGYVALSGWIYVTDWRVTGTKDVELRARIAGVDEGTSVSLSNYINEFVFDVWQKFVIPLSDMNLETSTIDQLIITTIDIGGGPAPDYYLDNIQFEETGAPITFAATAVEGTIFVVNRLLVTIAANVTDVDFDTYMGVSVTNPILFMIQQDGILEFAGAFAKISDSLWTGGQIINRIDNPTKTLITLEVPFDGKYTFDSRRGDGMFFTLGDDFSSLTLHRGLLTGKKESL